MAQQDADNGWSVGQEVALYGAYGRGAIGIGRVEKIYKNGNVVVNGVRYRVHGNFGHETGDGFARRGIGRLTPELRQEAERHHKLKKVQDAGSWLVRLTDPDLIPDDLARSLIKIMQDNK